MLDPARPGVDQSPLPGGRRVVRPAVRVRITGYGGPTDYLNPQVVPGEVVDSGTRPDVPGTGASAGPLPVSGAAVIPFPSPWERPRAHEQHDKREPDDQDLEDEDPQGGAR